MLISIGFSLFVMEFYYAVKVMIVSIPFQSLRTRTTSESFLSSFVSSTSTSSFNTATMTSNSSSVNVSGSTDIVIAGEKGEQTHAKQRTSEVNEQMMRKIK